MRRKLHHIQKNEENGSSLYVLNYADLHEHRTQSDKFELKRQALSTLAGEIIKDLRPAQLSAAKRQKLQTLEHQFRDFGGILELDRTYVKCLKTLCRLIVNNQNH